MGKNVYLIISNDIFGKRMIFIVWNINWKILKFNGRRGLISMGLESPIKYI